MTYDEFLRNLRENEAYAIEHIYNILEREIFGGDLSDDVHLKLRVMEIAEHVFVALKHGGVEFVFDDEGEFQYVIT